MASAVPPAARIFSAALPLNLCARTFSSLPPSPRARIFTLASAPATNPRSRSRSGVTTTPALKNAPSVSRLTTSYSTRNGLWKPRLGTRRCSGIWPPSKPRLRLKPERDCAPLCPRPAVFPWPDPWPRPTRFFECFAPRGGRRFERLINPAILPFCNPAIARASLNGDQVTHFVNHPTRGRRVFEFDGVPDAAQAEATHDQQLLAIEPDRTLLERHLDGGAFGISSLICHLSHALVLPNSSRVLPRSRATVPGSLSAARPAMVARTTLCGFAHPSDLVSILFTPP